MAQYLDVGRCCNERGEADKRERGLLGPEERESAVVCTEGSDDTKGTTCSCKVLVACIRRQIEHDTRRVKTHR